MVKAINPHGF